MDRDDDRQSLTEYEQWEAEQDDADEINLALDAANGGATE